MTPDDEVLTAVRAIVERVAGASRTPAGIGPDTRLGDGLWLDSVELLEVIVACEHEFGITFDDGDDLERGGLETLGALAALIRAKQSARPRKP
jgi:acyl carrier protein